MQATGRSIRSYQQGNKVIRDFRIIKLGLDLPKPELHARIHARVDGMVEQGLVQEVQDLLPYRHLNALNTVGYTELFDYFDGTCSLEEAIDRIKINTRHYAKRQLTWFRKDHEIKWLAPNEMLRSIV
jgi:tRNA dimethylallyltransferase